MDTSNHNQSAWNYCAKSKDRWMVPVSKQEIENEKKRKLENCLDTRKTVKAGQHVK